jgi:hypothetical protein
LYFHIPDWSRCSHIVCKTLTIQVINVHRWINNFSFSYSKCKCQKARMFWILLLVFWHVTGSLTDLLVPGLFLHLQESGSLRKILIACLLEIKSLQTHETVHYTHTISCSSFSCSGSSVKFQCYISVLCAEYFGLNSNLHWHQLHYIFDNLLLRLICVLILSNV